MTPLDLIGWMIFAVLLAFGLQIVAGVVGL